MIVLNLNPYYVVDVGPMMFGFRPTVGLTGRLFGYNVRYVFD